MLTPRRFCYSCHSCIFWHFVFPSCVSLHNFKYQPPTATQGTQLACSEIERSFTFFVFGLGQYLLYAVFC